ncbi:unnamed protein product, partial [Phaeothamnion confervicola]
MTSRKRKLSECESSDALPFRFDLPGQRPQLVASVQELTAVTAAMQSALLLGIDTETKPLFRKGAARQPTSLMQIAVRGAGGAEVVFILDLLALSRFPAAVDEALARVMEDREVFKLGQGLRDDLKQLAFSYPAIQSFRHVRGILERSNVHLLQLNPGVAHTVALRKLCMRYLHATLRKKEQTSNWGRRPLTQSQVEYAANDALVLLRVYDVIWAEVADVLPGYNVWRLLTD